MTNPFRPLLAATIKDHSDLERLTYPMIASPKLDGIRCLIHPELGPVSRKLKPIPNWHIRTTLSQPALHGLDGEIISGASFTETTSNVMSQDGKPDFTYFVFDDFTDPSKPYRERLASLTSQHPNVKVLDHWIAETISDVLEFEGYSLACGYEGLMLRAPNGHYKFNRSTFNEQILLKLKNFIDTEATVIGFEELERNNNEAKSNELGHTERSSSQSGKVKMNTLGSLVVTCPDFDIQFKIGSGFDQATRLDIWNNRGSLLGSTVKFRYQDIGIKDRPRFPTFLGFRLD